MRKNLPFKGGMTRGKTGELKVKKHGNTFSTVFTEYSFGFCQFRQLTTIDLRHRIGGLHLNFRDDLVETKNVGLPRVLR